MKKTRNLLTALLLLAALNACTDDEIKEDYVFGNIEYLCEPGDGESRFEVPIPSIIQENDSDEDLPFTVEPYKDTPCEVTLESDDPAAFAWKGADGLYIPQPIFLNGNTVTTNSGDEVRRPYRQGTHRYAYDMPAKSTHTTTLPPHTRLEVTRIMRYRKTQVTYLLTLKGEYTRKEKPIKGKLTYTYPESVSHKFYLSKIE